MYPHCGCALLWSVQPLVLLSLSLLPLTPIFQQFLIHILISSTFTYVMFYDIVDALSFSFSFPPSPSSIEQFHYYKHVLHMSLYMIMFAFVHMFIIWIYLPRMRESMWLLYFWSWILTWRPAIYFQTTCHYSLWLSKTPLYIWFIYIWTSVYRCLYCILTYVLLGRYPGVVWLHYLLFG
jgi:hypothetical protein